MQSEEDLAKCFARVKFLVLDEADRLLEPTFESELVVIAKALPAQRQTLLFSATMTKSLVTMQEAALQDAYHFQVDNHSLHVGTMKVAGSRVALRDYDSLTAPTA